METGVGVAKAESARGPRSWAEDIKSYRDTRGSRSLSAVSSAADAPQRYSRTTYVPFSDTKHPLYAYNDFEDNPGMTQPSAVDGDRTARHGWGDVSLTKQDGFAGVLNPRREAAPRIGKGQPPHAGGKDGRTDLFATLQYRRDVQPTADSWIGNSLIDPTKKKGFPLPPADPKGRHDLFDVLHARSPGVPADDAWLGHSKIDPARGKAHPPGPEQRRGRRDLGEVYSHQILRETAERRAELTAHNGAGDPYCDGWIGNRLVHPASGKAPVAAAAVRDALFAATVRPDAATGDLLVQTKPVLPCAVGETLRGGPPPPGGEFGRRGRKEVDVPLGTTAAPPRRDHLYAHMTYRAVSDTERSVLSHTYDDGRHHKKRHMAEPGSGGPAQGPDMLHHKPDVRIACYVPFGGLAQQQPSRRTVAPTVTADTLSTSLRR